jgi:hypothetical protein
MSLATLQPVGDITPPVLERVLGLGVLREVGVLSVPALLAATRSAGVMKPSWSTSSSSNSRSILQQHDTQAAAAAAAGMLAISREQQGKQQHDSCSRLTSGSSLHRPGMTLQVLVAGHPHSSAGAEHSCLCSNPSRLQRLQHCYEAKPCLPLSSRHAAARSPALRPAAWPAPVRQTWLQ